MDWQPNKKYSLFICFIFYISVKIILIFTLFKTVDFMDNNRVRMGSSETISH